MAVRPSAREQIVDKAYEAFTHRAVRAVDLEEVGERSGVDAETLASEFPDKDALVLAALARREELWTLGFVELEARRRGDSPETRLLGIFDAFDEWFHRDDFEGCTFINVLLEMGSQHALGQESLSCLDRIRGIVKELANDANLRDVEEFALTFHMLMKGSIIAACEGQKNAARLVKPLAQALIEQHR